MSELKKLVAELYQVCGVLNAPAKVLDQLSAAANGKRLPHKTLLPFHLAAQPKLTLSEEQVRDVFAAGKTSITEGLRYWKEKADVLNALLAQAPSQPKLKLYLGPRRHKHCQGCCEEYCPGVETPALGQFIPCGFKWEIYECNSAKGHAGPHCDSRKFITPTGILPEAPPTTEPGDLMEKLAEKLVLIIQDYGLLVQGHTDTRQCAEYDIEQELVAHDTKVQAEAEARGIKRLKIELLSLMHQERVRISGKWHEKPGAVDVPHEEVMHCISPMTVTLANVIEIINIRLRALLPGEPPAPLQIPKGHNIPVIATDGGRVEMKPFPPAKPVPEVPQSFKDAFYNRQAQKTIENSALVNSATEPAPFVCPLCGCKNHIRLVGACTCTCHFGMSDAPAPGKAGGGR
jgi:hypothetical protein